MGYQLADRQDLNGLFEDMLETTNPGKEPLHARCPQPGRHARKPLEEASGR